MDDAVIWRPTWLDDDPAGVDYSASRRGRRLGRVYWTANGGHEACHWVWAALTGSAPMLGRETSRRAAMLALEDRVEGEGV